MDGGGLLTSGIATDLTYVVEYQETSAAERYANTALLNSCV
jgi:hypothetical protein